MEANYQFLETSIQKDLGIKVSDIKVVEQGLTNRVYLAQSNGREIFIRIDQGKKSFPIEIACYQRLSSIGIPVPTILGYQESPESIGNPTIVLSKVPGKPIHDSELSLEQQYDLYIKAGAILRKIHQVTILGFGQLRVEHDELKGESKSWKEIWTNYLSIPKELDYLIQNKLLSAEEGRTIEKILSEVYEVEVPQASLLHGDYQTSHIFTDGKDITGIIDLGSALAGDPRYDIAIALFFFEHQFHQPFKEGYGGVTNDPLIQKYLSLVSVYKTGWRHRKGEMDGADKALRILRTSISL